MGKEDCARGQTYLIFCFHNISAGINLSLKKKKKKEEVGKQISSWGQIPCFVWEVILGRTVTRGVAAAEYF